ncbi:hypothetical protein ACIQCG_01175 [Streptomyces noursei]|uniref:hypothetical protein n=1 Tax=Streptomyces noursei TaxID=1971 RepID=UPI0037F2CB8E
MPYRTRAPRWTAAQMDAYEQARALLNALIAAYSARISEASPEAANALREQRAPLLVERDALTADDSDRIDEILREIPTLLAAVRGGTDE